MLHQSPARKVRAHPRIEAMTIFTHNGRFTIKSLRTGAHRTFQVRTQAEDAGFWSSERVPGVTAITASAPTPSTWPIC
jgi:hypothetical protein